MRLSTKLLLTIGVPLVLIWVVGAYVSRVSEETVRATIEARTRSEVRSVLEEIERLIRDRASSWQAYGHTSGIEELLKESNREYDAMPNPGERIRELDAIWVGDDAAQAEALVRSVTEHQISEDLQSSLRKLREIAGYRVFGEVFLTNRHGAVVASSGRTEDFEQSDETWWKEAMAEQLWVADAGRDESAGIDAIEICPRIDSKEGDPLGVFASR